MNPYDTAQYAPAYREAFSKILPYDTVFNKNLLTGLAESQINPEISRAQNKAFSGFDRNMAQTGGFRTGVAGAERQGIADQYERQRKEQVSGFLDSINNNLNDWYNRQYEMYYKNPSAYVTPSTMTMDQFMAQNPSLASAYNSGTNVPVTYNNPLLF